MKYQCEEKDQMNGVKHNQIMYISNTNSFRDKLQIREKLTHTSPSLHFRLS
jgi:hypothetical protein